MAKEKIKEINMDNFKDVTLVTLIQGAKEMNKILAPDPPIPTAKKTKKADIVKAIDECKGLFDPEDKISKATRALLNEKFDAKIPEPKTAAASGKGKGKGKVAGGKKGGRPKEESARQIVCQLVQEGKYTREQIIEKAGKISDRLKDRPDLVKLYLTAWKKGDRVPEDKTFDISTKGVMSFK